MTQIPSELNALLGSRICHDLISPLGAIGNGLELLQMTGAADTPELALISDAVEDANARIRLFRIAFGAAACTQQIGWDEIAPCVARFGQHRGAVAHWSPEQATDRAAARLGMLLLLVAETLMPRGGHARIELAERVTLTIEGDRLRDAPEMLAQLTGADEALPAAGAIHFRLARIAAEELGRRIELRPATGGLVIVA